MDRRHFIKASGAAAGATLLGADFWRPAFVEAAALGPGPYGALGAPDANGLRLPAGFTSRVIGRCGQPVAGTGYVWPLNPDGGQCFPTTDGGWIYVANSEIDSGKGGASAVRFSRSGSITNAYSICSGTSRNCSGGITPWRTYLSCEETTNPMGQVYECDPYRPGNGVLRPGLGSFNHEAAVTDPDTGYVYLTEDDPSGRLYRFVPVNRGDLSVGQLFAASVRNGAVTWVPTSSSAPDRQATTTAFKGGEGMFMGDHVVYFVTKIDEKIWELDLRTNRITEIHDASTAPADNLDAVDALVVHYLSGDIFVAEDGGNMEVGVLGRVNGQRQVASFLRIDGHAGSEVTGLAFSPDGSRLYLSSQRGTDRKTGITYEVRGPFRTASSPLNIDRSSYVRGNEPTANFGGDVELKVCTNASEDFVKYAFLSVDTTRFDPVLTKAVLRVTARLSSPTTSSLRVRTVAANWTESGITWANRPTFGGVIGTIDVTSTEWSSYSLDISKYVIAERAAGRKRVAVAFEQAEDGEVVLLRSSEATSGRPTLAVTPMTFPGLQAVTMPAAYDAHVRGGRVARNTNYATSPRLEVRTSTDAAQRRQAYIAFDTSSFVRSVDAATVRVTARSTDGSSQLVDVYATSSAWTETEINFTNRPALQTRVGSFTVTSSSMRAYSVDITGHVKARRTGGQPLISLAFVAHSNGELIEIVSSEGGSGLPKLSLV